MKTQLVPLAFLVLTALPTAYQASLSSRPKANFDLLTRKIERLNIRPENWKARELEYGFGQEWRSRLGLQYHRAATLVAPDGQTVTVLLMLSENGEQLFHTPAVCYAAHGCDLVGEATQFALEGD